MTKPITRILLAFICAYFIGLRSGYAAVPAFAKLDYETLVGWAAFEDFGGMSVSEDLSQGLMLRGRQDATSTGTLIWGKIHSLRDCRPPSL